MDNCAICRNSLAEFCIECEGSDTQPTIGPLTSDGQPAIIHQCNWTAGDCGHMYHQHCIDRWLLASKVCPLCNRAWSPITRVRSLVELACQRIASSHPKYVIQLHHESPNLPQSVWSWIRTYSEKSNTCISGPLAYILANQTRAYSGIEKAVVTERNRIYALLSDKVPRDVLVSIMTKPS